MENHLLFLESSDKQRTRIAIPGTSSAELRESDGKEYGELRDILKGGRIKTVFQPIVSLKTTEVYGYEALSRIVGPSIFPGPRELFQAAERWELSPELERLCQDTAMNTAHKIGIQKNIFLNITPRVVDMPNYDSGSTASLAREFFKSQGNVVLELTEKVSCEENSVFRKALNYYRSQGFVIAIDDFGSGFAGLNMLLQVEPQIVKIDRLLVTDIHKSTLKRLLLESVVNFCHKVNARVIAEGIEKLEELRVVMDMKIDFAQGYCLARPDEKLQECSEEARKCILSFSGSQYRGVRQNHNFIGALAQPVRPLPPQESVSHAIEAFKKDSTLVSLPVVENCRPVGIVHKNHLFFKLGQQFGFSVYTRRPVRSVMKTPLVFEFNTPLEDASLRTLERSDAEIYDAVIVAKNGVYVGMVYVRDILARITDQKINLAVQANPLTGLPGNHIIQEEIETRLQSNAIFSTLYFDLDNFKPYNDHYGFERGDNIIRFLADLLKEAVFRWDPEAFLGHIGGDDFVAVCHPGDTDKLCEKILKKFDHGIVRFHDDETVARGYYESVNRKGNVEQFPVLSLSIAVVSNRHRVFESYPHLVSVASEVKTKAKMMPGSSFWIDRRRA